MFSVQSVSSDTAVLDVLPLEESPFFVLAEEDPKVHVSSRETVCGWSPRREWPDRPLASGVPHRPPSSEPAGIDPSLSDKLLKNYKEHGAILKELGLDPSVKDLEVTEEIPIGKEADSVQSVKGTLHHTMLPNYTISFNICIRPSGVVHIVTHI